MYTYMVQRTSMVVPYEYTHMVRPYAYGPNTRIWNTKYVWKYSGLSVTSARPGRQISIFPTFFPVAWEPCIVNLNDEDWEIMMSYHLCRKFWYGNVCFHSCDKYSLPPDTHLHYFFLRDLTLYKLMIPTSISLHCMKANSCSLLSSLSAMFTKSAQTAI